MMRSLIFENSALAFDIDPASLGLPSSFGDLGSLVTAALPPIIYLAGLLLFAYLILGGFKYLTSGGDDKAIMEGKKIITNAFMGMLIVFTSFWVIRFVESVLGLNITGYNP